MCYEFVIPDLSRLSLSTVGEMEERDPGQVGQARKKMLMPFLDVGLFPPVSLPVTTALLGGPTRGLGN